MLNDNAKDGAVGLADATIGKKKNDFLQSQRAEIGKYTV